MKEREIAIPTPDGEADGFLYENESGQRLPGVIFLTDIGGIRPSQREMAQRVADEGYTVLLPNIFYRIGEAPVFEMPMNFGEEGTTKRIQQLSASLPPEAFERDAPAYVAFLRSKSSLSDSRLGVIGLCFSGGLAMRMAAVEPQKIAAAASFHGGRLATDDPASPHLLLPQIKARVYFGHAVDDRSMPEEAIDKLDRALAQWGGHYESEVYQGAHHGWTVPDNPSYNQAQAERAYEKLRDLLAATLKPQAARAR